MMTTRRILVRNMSVFMAAGAAVVSLGKASAWAQMSLDQARREKLVGERSDALLSAMVNRPDVVAQVEQWNQERMAAYNRIAADEGIPVEQVQAIAAQQIFPRLPEGALYMDDNGRWVEK